MPAKLLDGTSVASQIRAEVAPAVAAFAARAGRPPGLGIVVCGAMIYGLGWTNWLRLIVWLAIGLVFYFTYGKSHSKLASAEAAVR